jgi:hypothetical protein
MLTFEAAKAWQVVEQTMSIAPYEMMYLVSPPRLIPFHPGLSGKKM